MSLLIKAANEAKLESPEQAQVLLDAQLDPGTKKTSSNSRTDRWQLRFYNFCTYLRFIFAALNGIGNASSVESVRKELLILCRLLGTSSDGTGEDPEGMYRIHTLPLAALAETSFPLGL